MIRSVTWAPSSADGLQGGPNHLDGVSRMNCGARACYAGYFTGGSRRRRGTERRGAQGTRAKARASFSRAVVSPPVAHRPPSCDLDCTRASQRGSRTTSQWSPASRCSCSRFGLGKSPCPADDSGGVGLAFYFCCVRGKDTAARAREQHSARERRLGNAAERPAFYRGASARHRRR